MQGCAQSERNLGLGVALEPLVEGKKSLGLQAKPAMISDIQHEISIIISET